MRLVWAKWLARLPGHKRIYKPFPIFFSLRAWLTAQLTFILLFLTLIPSHANCQDFASLKGTITDSLLNQPIAGVVITILPDGRSTQTSSIGSFQFNRIAPGIVTLHIESAFHATRIIGPFLLREGEQRVLDFTLIPTDQQGETVEVYAVRESGIGITSLSLTPKIRSNASTVGDFLNRSGFHLESDGRTKYASLRGFSPQCVLVLVDGVPINPDGAPADLSTIPTESVERVDIYTTGAASRFGANALGGAVNIISRTTASPDRTASVAATSGSFDLHRGAANVAFGNLGGVSANAGYDYQQQLNDFNFKHPYEGKQTRVNNSSRIYSGFLSLRPEKIPGLNLQGRISNSHIEIPGAIFQETNGGAMAKRENRYLSLGYTLSRLRLTATMRELHQKFVDRGGFIVYDKEYLQTARLIQGQFEGPIMRHFIFTAGSEYSSETFSNDDFVAPQRSLPKVSRKTIAAYSGLTALRNVGILEFSAEIRHRVDLVDDKSHSSPFAGVGLNMKLPITLGGQASYSESYRLPPIDALFWRGDVFSEANPQLRPEQAISREVGLTLKYDRSFLLAANHTWFKSNVTDLIIWRRQFDGKYKPVNIDQSQYVGTETSLSLSPKSRRIELTYHRTSLSSTNLSSSSGYYGQIVPFKPDQVERLALEIDFVMFTVQYSYAFTGERQIREANTKSLPGFALHDLFLEIPFSVWSRRHTLQVAVFNITDQHYELLERMPMPPRSASLTLNIQI